MFEQTVMKCTDALQKNWGIPQRQENNKLTSPKARERSLYFRISMKTWMGWLERTYGRASTSHLFYWNLPKSVLIFYFSLILKYPPWILPASTSVPFQSVLYGLTIEVCSSQILFPIQKLPVDYNHIQNKIQTAYNGLKSSTCLPVVGLADE